MANYTCKVCGEMCCGVESIRFHVMETHIHGQVSCPFCDLSGITANEMEIHLNFVHLKEQTERQRDIIPKENLTSRLSSDSLTTQVSLEGSSCRKELDCPLCPFNHVDEELLRHHVNNYHFEKDGESNSKKVMSTTEPTCLKYPSCTYYEYMNESDLSKHVDPHHSKENKNSSDDYLFALRLNEEELRKRDGEMKNFNLLKRQYGMENEGSFGEQSISQMERAVYDGEISVMDYHVEKLKLKESEISGMDDGISVTFDILPTLKKLCYISNDTQRSYFCSSNIDHYGSSYGDKGWGCGYRNLQMLISSIQYQRNARSILSKFNLISSHDLNCVSPSICTLQKAIEKAWKSGYDTVGGEQLGGKLHQTRKWIGATEIVAFFTAHQIRTQIFDFHSPSGSNETHPALFKWDSNGEPFIPPLYLQHQGHSRTIVGVEVLKKNNSIRLLILDPSHSHSQISKGLSPTNLKDTKVLHLMRKNICSIKSRKYQIVAVTGTYSSEQEASLHKRITFSRISNNTFVEARNYNIIMIALSLFFISLHFYYIVLH
ncbi:zinc finger-containing ubiquitin peptidase 1 isoform X2 [Lepeophtheirus salmonis]|uniref:zinc finger-containing ubiquitin peptidase 1 isoform X2 n=2 Tax=Lepeophtheirus salmonis TaxID=72036 RepID=UPI001AEB71EC|nr:zinc finger-containing ubiquitin peptidase 1-like isoform X2 [Lepeophtheirus salmonis]